jgi:hypothetical protein
MYQVNAITSQRNFWSNFVRTNWVRWEHLA